jgi:hypothetical protein
MSLLSNPVPRTDRKKSSNECSPTDSHIYDPGADDGIVLAQSGHREGVGCNFRARLVEKLANVRFSNRPFEVKHFQTIHHCSVDVAHGLALLFGIGTKALPLWDSRTRRNNLWVGFAVTPTAGPSGQPPTTIERWHPTYMPRPNYAWRFRVGGRDRAIDRSPIDFRSPEPPSALWR